VPHFHLPGGSSLYDEFGPVFTLLRCKADEDVAEFVVAAEGAGVPLKVLDIAPPAEVASLYRHPLVLVRPDQHVAWRGSADVANPAEILDTIRGAGD
jgi:hypothetical protein